jgi:hypothetical protein
MIRTTPAQERYTRFSCPNPQCTRFNRPGEGTIAHRSWTGTHKHIERLRWTACGQEFSAREGTLMAHSKLPEDTVIRLVKCQRWDVCDEGTADICAGDLKTVHRFQRVAAQRAEPHHRQVVREVDVPGVQVDEAHSKLRPRQVAWIHTALAMGRWFLLGGDIGPRTQEQAAALVAQVVARGREVPLFLTDGWKAYRVALLQVLGVVYRRRRQGKRGRKPHPRLVAPLRRRTRCLSWSRPRHRGRLWLLVSLYNFVMPHKSLRQGRTPRTPAMAIGLTDHVWSYREYIWLPVHTDPVLIHHMEGRITNLLTPALQAPPGDNTPAKSPPAEAKEEKADTTPKAA